MGITEDMRQSVDNAKKSVGIKEKSGVDKAKDQAKSALGKMGDDVKGALGIRPKTDKYYDYGLVAVRLALAIVLLHGISLLGSPAGDSFGIPLSGFAAALAGLLEMLAGLAILLGVVARVSGALVALDMAVSILLTSSMLGRELEAVLLLCGLAIALTGPGRFSLEEKIAGGKDSPLHRI